MEEKRTLSNPDKEPLKGGICLVDSSCCVASSAWTDCNPLIAVAGYSKRLFAIHPSIDGTVRNCFSCDIAGSVAAPLLSCRCCCSGSKSSILAAATSGWLMHLSMDNRQQFAQEWSLKLDGPLFSAPVCLPFSLQSPSVAVASATGQVFVVSALLGNVLQRLQPLQSPCSFMSAPRVVLSSLDGRLLVLLASAGNGGIFVFDCVSSGLSPLARLIGQSAGNTGASFLSAPCIHRLEPLEDENSFVVLACASDGKLYAVAYDSDRWKSLDPSRFASKTLPLASSTVSDVAMREIFDAECGVFCTPAVVPVFSLSPDEAAPSTQALIQQRSRRLVSLAVVIGGRDNIMRCCM